MRLTDEQKESLAKAAGVDLVDAIVACILRLDEEVEPVHPSHLTTVVENLECERDEALAARDEALAVRANQEATIEDLGEALASAIDERDAALAALAKLADVDRLLAIEEQAKRVARAERWHEWTRLAYRDVYGREAGAAFDAAREAYLAERRKLAEMVGEGDET